MSSRTEVNQLIRTRIKAKCVLLDIHFLKKCLGEKVFPKFIHINTCKSNIDLSKIILNAKISWLKLETGYKYKKLQELEEQGYYQHLKLARSYSDSQWDDFQRILHHKLDKKTNEKRSILDKKFEKLIIKKKTLRHVNV